MDVPEDQQKNIICSLRLKTLRGSLAGAPPFYTTWHLATRLVDSLSLSFSRFTTHSCQNSSSRSHVCAHARFTNHLNTDETCRIEFSHLLNRKNQEKQEIKWARNEINEHVTAFAYRYASIFQTTWPCMVRLLRKAFSLHWSEIAERISTHFPKVWCNEGHLDEQDWPKSLIPNNMDTRDDWAIF